MGIANLQGIFQFAEHVKLCRSQVSSVQVYCWGTRVQLKESVCLTLKESVCLALKESVCLTLKESVCLMLRVSMPGAQRVSMPDAQGVSMPDTQRVSMPGAQSQYAWRTKSQYAWRTKRTICTRLTTRLTWTFFLFFISRTQSICPRCTATYRLIVRPLSSRDF